MNVVARIFGVLLAVVVAGQAGDARSSGVECCSRCGSVDGVQTVCRPVHTTRSEEVVCWDVVCEPICVPGKTNQTRTRHKLMRKTFLKQVPVVYWVVEPACVVCSGSEAGGYDAGDYRPMPLTPSPRAGSIMPTAGIEERDTTGAGGSRSGAIQALFHSSLGQDRRKNF